MGRTEGLLQAFPLFFISYFFSSTFCHFTSLVFLKVHNTPG